MMLTQIGLADQQRTQSVANAAHVMTDLGNFEIAKQWFLHENLLNGSLIYLRAVLTDMTNQGMYEEGSLVDALIKGENGVSTRDATLDTIQLLLYDHQNISIPLATLLFELGRNPQILEELKNEVIENKDQEDYLVRPGTLLDRSWLEILRMYPAIPMLSRTVGESDIQVNGFKIPARSIVLMSKYHENRSTEKWGANAHSFDPGRMIDKTEEAISVFGKGARNCIGRYFAGYALKLVLSCLLQRKLSWTSPKEDLEPFAASSLQFKTPPTFRLTDDLHND
jgi:cytochrome P450